MTFERYEIKYRMTHAQQQAVLEAMAPHMVPDAFAHSSIRNLYLDTPDYRLIRRSLEKPVYKEKMRIRSYGPAGAGDEVFVELKKKYRSVVYKRRLTLSQQDTLACVAGQRPWPHTQIGSELDYTTKFYRTLRPAVFLSYERDAYRGIQDPELRITFDSDIRFRTRQLTLDSQTWGYDLLGEDEVLMALKVAGGLPLWLVRVLSAQHIYQTSYSKYGTAYQLMAAAPKKGLQRYA